MMLALPEVCTALIHWMLQAQHLPADIGTEVGQLKDTPQVSVWVLAEGVQVHSKCAAKENSILVTEETAVEILDPYYFAH